MPISTPVIAKPLQNSFRLFQGNYNQLINFLQHIEESPDGIKLWAQRNSNWFYITEEISRLFFNFAVSAVTFVDRTEELFSGLPKNDELSQLMKDYKQVKESRFDKNPRYRLIDGFRHYLIHVDVIRISSIYHWDRDTGHKHTIVISKEELLTGIPKKLLRKGLGFDSITRKELTIGEPNIAMRPLIEECFNNLQEFNQWLWDKQRELINSHLFHI